MIRFKKLYENYNCFTIDRSANLRCCFLTEVRVVTHFLCHNKLQDYLVTFTPLCLTNVNTYHSNKNFIQRSLHGKCQDFGSEVNLYLKKKIFPLQLFYQFNIIQDNLHLLTMEFVFQHTYFTPVPLTCAVLCILHLVLN